MVYKKTRCSRTWTESSFYYKDEECTILHREDGPACEWVNGYKEFYLNGEEYSEEEYWATIRFGYFV